VSANRNSIEPRALRRDLANRLWRPSLFWDDDALLKPSSWINDPWWHKYDFNHIRSLHI